MPQISIPLIDLSAQYRSIHREIDQAIQRVVASGQFILGPEVEAFEREMASYCGVSDAVAVASGTDALELSLRACGIGPGDEVITTVYSFIAAVEAILAVGAIPVLADIELPTYTLDPQHVEALITRKTKAIMPVHLYGHPCQMDRLTALATHHGVKLIEDCAQAVGASFRGRRVGSFGDAGCFSFYPSKNLGGYGDGGMVVTNDPSLAEQVRLLRAHGSRQRYHHLMIGTNSRLDELQAAILRVKLRHLDQWTAARRRLAECYRKTFHRYGLKEVALPEELPGCVPVYHLYCIRTPARERIQDTLSRQGIATQVAYPSTLLDQPALQSSSAKAGPCPTARSVAQQILALPFYPELSDDAVERVVRYIADIHVA